MNSLLTQHHQYVLYTVSVMPLLATCLHIQHCQMPVLSGYSPERKGGLLFMHARMCVSFYKYMLLGAYT